MNIQTIRQFEQDNPHLAYTLRDLRGRPVKYFVNHGNAGDGLIAAATYQLLRHYDVDFQVLTKPEQAKELRNETVLLAGGGNLVPLYHGMAAVMEGLLAGRNKIILLPHSVGGNERLLSALPSSASIYCRERGSWRHVRKHAPQCDVLLGHDLAFYTDVQQLRAVAETDDMGKRFRALLDEKANLTPAMVSGTKMSCLRGGLERTSSPSGRNYDVSVMFRSGVTPGKAETDAWMLLEFTRLAAEITTNRLHIGIAAALNGTKTVLHDNSYGKVSGVFTHSMRDRFPNVSFEGEMRTHEVFA